MEFEECPKCGNEKITQHSEEIYMVVYSVVTGKVLKRDKNSSGTNCWHFECKCGWVSEVLSE